jgi:hypothetical protein
MFRIRTDFTADPDPAFYLNAYPDTGSQTNTEPDPGQTLPSQKFDSDIKNNICYVGNVS